jgi:DNA polymerase elongation subunit (family B)
LQALNLRLIDLLGNDYAIALDKPQRFTHEGKPFKRYKIRCIYHSHNEAHHDRNPSGWIAVSENDSNLLISGCWVCERPQIIKCPDGYQPAPTLLTLSRNDPLLLKVLHAFGCKEVEEVNGREQPAVAFPITYADGSQGYHYRVALEGKDKWRHKEGGKAGEAVFALHRKGIQSGIQNKHMLIVTESPVDATVLNAAGFPAIAVLGKGNAGALACDFHKQTLLDLLGDDGVIYAWNEPDAEGFAQDIANALQRPVKVISPPDYAKDAFRLWVACGKDWDKFVGEISGLLENVTEVAPQPATEHKIVTVRQRLKEAVWRPLGEITMSQNDCWQVEGLIKQGNLVILSARPKTAKSIVALNLAACVAMGKPFLDRSVTQGRALFVAYERYDLTLQRALAMGLAGYYDFMLWDKAAYGLPHVDCLDGWVDFIERNGVKLIVIDTLAHFLKPELAKVRNAINAYDHVYNVMGMVKSAAEETSCTFLLIHHDRKGETAETDEAQVLGTTALTAAADAVFQLKPMSDKVVCLKATGNAIEDTALYFKVGEDFWIELTEKPTTTKEEKAARAIEDYLRQHGEATRQQVIDLMLEIGLAENKTTAGKLVDRAIQDRLVTKVKKEYKGGELVYHWQGGRVISPAPHSDSDPQDSPDRPTDPQGGLKTTTTDMEFVYGVYRQKATVDNVDIVDNDRLVYGVYNSQPDQSDLQRRLTPKTNLINVYNSRPEARPEGDPQAAQPEPDPLSDPTDQPETAGSQTDSPEGNDFPPDPFVVWFDEGFIPDLIVCGSPPEPEQPDQPEQPEQSEDDPQGSPPVSEPEDNPPAQPVATLNEPICSICGEMLDPEPDSGLAACLGCGRLFKIEIPPVSPDDDDNPPETPNNNGNGGGHNGFSPPEAPVNPPANLIYTHKFNSPESLTRMTERLPDGSIKLSWQGKTETVAPDDLAGWQPIETIPEVDLPDIETVEIPPVVVIDLETNGLDPSEGHILAAGLALYVAGKEEEAQIIRSDNGEANLLAEVFDYLQETCDSLGEFILTGYNLFDFDLTFLIERARRLGIKHACPFRFVKDENGKIKRLPIPDTNGKYTYNSVVTNLPILLIDTQHLVIRWDMFEKVLPDYRLKSVAVHFKVNIPNRPELRPEEIREKFQNDPETFDAYLHADLQETYALFDMLIKPYAGIAALTGLNLEDIARKYGRGWIWEQIYERHYNEIPQADEIRKYVGGLVVSRKGLWFNCAKFDIASLYPTIMLAYRIHSRKDPKQIGLRYLKTFWIERLSQKQKAKETGDETAQILQESLKVLINSHYGFCGSAYPFNDIDAAERVTKIGRKILTSMVAAVEDAGGIVVEADTDGIIVSCQDKDPQEILQAISAAIPPVFKVELEWQGMIVFVSEDKHYIVFDRNYELILVKGSKWRGRDKPAYMTKAIPTFLQYWLKQGKEAALDYARQVLAEIRSGQGWRWVVCTRTVGRNNTNFLRAGFKAGEKATFAYKNWKQSEIAKSPDEGYDCDYYAKEFSKRIKEVIEAIDPAQIAAWREMVGREARPLIFATN